MVGVLTDNLYQSTLISEFTVVKETLNLAMLIFGATIKILY